MGEFRMPALGADMVAGTLTEWYKHPGNPFDEATSLRRWILTKARLTSRSSRMEWWSAW
jgi:hypothetical protein